MLIIAEKVTLKTEQIAAPGYYRTVSTREMALTQAQIVDSVQDIGFTHAI